MAKPILFSKRIFAALALWVCSLTVVAAAQVHKQVEIYGQKIHYVEAGSGPAVILLHGLGGDATNWAMTVPVLASKYHVYVPDQIGFGQSDKPLMNYRVATLVEFLAQFYKKLNIEKATLVGNSLGGWTAASFAIAHPEKVDKLVLVDAAGYTAKRWGGAELTKELYAVLNPATTADLKRAMSLVFYNKALITDAFIETAFANKLKKGDSPTINAFIDSVLRGEDFIDDKVKTIKTPTLVVWGREDGLTPLAIGEAFAQDIVGAQKLVIEKCGHVPQLEKAAEFNTGLLKFLESGSTEQTKQ
ncbi:MAG TPA: alpha/beta fold hydrolase [Blastocatellia bacterium]|nr:alpha/beta fold hydrolase [Blastocatellia bacterium]HMV84980.1 alpha/beta fold hydrolase [Blastocatellia bacterium]HMX24791.1 alpha/beta fold hydrolase [Blastocatellia bacterium]HMY71003.1 alpha/beta fold hydrolase [Blastocatellia bacterium]HMZ18091.1 alpha/beta fold hydrolase [Blastocatellia bacterium]